MMLNFGTIKLDTKGMPAVSDIHVNRSTSDDRPALVYVRLASRRRADVEKWAKRLGTEVTKQLNPLYQDDPTPLEFCAVVEADGYRVELYTRAAVETPDPAGLPWQVYAQPADGGARWLVNAFATRQLAERFAERHPAEYGPLTIERAAGAGPVLHWPARGLRQTTCCQGEPLPVESFAVRESAVTCPACAVRIVGEAAVNGGVS